MAPPKRSATTTTIERDDLCRLCNVFLRTAARGCLGSCYRVEKEPLNSKLVKIFGVGYTGRPELSKRICWRCQAAVSKVLRALTILESWRFGVTITQEDSTSAVKTNVKTVELNPKYPESTSQVKCHQKVITNSHVQGYQEFPENCKQDKCHQEITIEDTKMAEDNHKFNESSKPTECHQDIRRSMKSEKGNDVNQEFPKNNKLALCQQNTAMSMNTESVDKQYQCNIPPSKLHQLQLNTNKDVKYNIVKRESLHCPKSPDNSHHDSTQNYWKVTSDNCQIPKLNYSTGTDDTKIVEQSSSEEYSTKESVTNLPVVSAELLDGNSFCLAKPFPTGIPPTDLVPVLKRENSDDNESANDNCGFISPKETNPNEAFISNAQAQKILPISDSVLEYRCYVCGMFVVGKLRLNEHLKTHCGIDCEDCSKGSCSRSNLMRNREGQICNEDNKCDLETSLQTKKNLKEECRQTFNTNYNVEKQLKSNNDGPLICPKCNKWFKGSITLQKHQLTHVPTNERPLVCKECGKRFNLRYDLNTHMKAHAKMPFFCEKCGKKMRSEYTLKLHMMHHTDDLPYVCKECGKGYFRIGGLKKHMITHQTDWQHICKVCGKVFLYKHNLNRHVNVHKSRKCEICGKFYPKDGLKAHVKIHENDRPFMCELCGKCFKTKAHMGVHKKYHSDERPHVCTECGKSFREECSLKRHIKIHTNEREYVCKECGKGFNQSSTLRFHMRSHENKRAYVCKECGKGFNHRASLRGHMETHSIGQQCRECGKNFKHRTTLRKHLKTHSGT
ncbi:uncharacterized protein LOC144434083 [Glandiceps talaboti]